MPAQFVLFSVVDFSVLVLLAVSGALLVLSVVVVDSDDFSETSGLAGAAGAPAEPVAPVAPFAPLAPGAAGPCVIVFFSASHPTAAALKADQKCDGGVPCRSSHILTHGLKLAKQLLECIAGSGT
jgi:hypothetical protein